MSDQDMAVCELPKQRTGEHVKWLANASMPKVALTGLGYYVAIVLAFWMLEVLCLWMGFPVVVYQEGTLSKAANEWQILYFNFGNMLTIGYGDLTPKGIGCIFAVVEVILGIGVVGLIIAALTAKFLSPPPDAIVFSRYGYYCLDTERFLLIFVNTTRNLVINAEMSSYVKLGGDWIVRPAIRSPFLTRSVQTFSMDRVPRADLPAALEKGGAFRFSVAGRIGDTYFSTAVEYSPKEIIVLKSKSEVANDPIFHEPSFPATDEFVKKFHYCPEGVPTLESFVARLPKQEDVQDQPEIELGMLLDETGALEARQIAIRRRVESLVKILVQRGREATVEAHLPAQSRLKKSPADEQPGANY